MLCICFLALVITLRGELGVLLDVSDSEYSWKYNNVLLYFHGIFKVSSENSSIPLLMLLINKLSAPFTLLLASAA